MSVRTGLDRGEGTAGPSIHVAIGDLGRGIPADDLERIFLPFVSTKKEGMGLGLAVCRTIIQVHRGSLWATNNAACGATLHFSLPVSECRPGPPAQRNA
jgi:signal transduction histidine kinase